MAMATSTMTNTNTPVKAPHMTHHSREISAAAGPAGWTIDCKGASAQARQGESQEQDDRQADVIGLFLIPAKGLGD
jgi:hypothetical protein